MLAGIIVGRLKSDPTIAVVQYVSSAAGCGNHSAAGIDKKVHETLQFLSQFCIFHQSDRSIGLGEFGLGITFWEFLAGAFQVVIHSSSKCR